MPITWTRVEMLSHLIVAHGCGFVPPGTGT
jgi:hypothetical protein